MSTLNLADGPIIKGRDLDDQLKFNIWIFLIVVISIVFIVLLTFLIIRESQKKKGTGGGSGGGSNPRGCSNSNECDQGLICENNVCRKLPGIACSGGNQCVSNHSCIDGTCQPVQMGQLNDMCNGREQLCASNLLCVNNVCTAQVGGYCDKDIECASPSTGCVNNRCVQASAGMLTGSCLPNNMCNTGLVCQQTTVEQITSSSCRLQSGQICLDDDECNSGVCMSGRCI